VPSEPRQLVAEQVRQHLEARRFPEAFELVLSEFRDRIFRLACGLLRDEHAAEDMTQEILVRIWKGLPGFQGAASLSTWVYTISRNACLTELRRRAARPTLSLQDPDVSAQLETSPALQTQAPLAGAEQDVQVFLAKLPEHYRRAVTLFYLEDKSYDEVSAMLGLPLGTVKTYLFRAKRTLLELARRRAMTASG